MSVKNKLDDYKQRQEAKAYFRSNNDLYLDAGGWIKVLILGFLVSVGCGIVLGYVRDILPFVSSIMYIIPALVIANTITKVSGVHSSQMAIAAVVLTFISYIMSYLAYTMIFYYQSLGIMINMFTIQNISSIIQSMLFGNLFSTIIMAVGLVFAYQQAQ